MRHVGLTVYQWGDAEQNRLLVKCIGPASQGLWNRGFVDRFWFDRFDARGPHFYVLYGVSPETRRTVEEQIAATLDEYLKASFSTVHLSPEQLEEIHFACRGKTLCEADRLPGMGANNTYFFFDHPEDGYPLRFARKGARHNELWHGFSELARWSLQQLMLQNGTSTHGSALRFIHAVDRELRHDREWAFRFWRYAAAALIHVLNDDRFSDAEMCSASLPPRIGPRNMESFSRVWDSLESAGDLFPALPSLVDLVRSEVDRGRLSEFSFLRELVHCGLAQLGLPVRLRAPILLFSMWRNIGPLPPAVPSRALQE